MFINRWFRTGDIGEVAHNMTLKIIGLLMLKCVLDF